MLQNAAEQGRLAVETAVAHLRGKTAPPEVHTPLPLITLDPELEQLLLRARRPGDEGLTIDTGLAQTLVKSLSDALEEATGQGKQAVLIVASQLRRSLAAFLRPHLPDAIVLGIAELPETRKVEVVASIGGQSQLPTFGG